MIRSIPIAVSTGSLYPLPTLESIQHLNEIGVRDVELTLQANEFFVKFDREFSMPILHELLALVQSGRLCVRSVHAPMTRADRCYNLWARIKHLEHAVEVCHLLGGQVVVVHPEHLFRTYEDTMGYLANNGVSLQASLLPGIKTILDQVHSANMVLALENIQDWYDEVYFNSHQNMLCFLSEIDHPALQFTFDLMHAAVAETLDGFTNSLTEHIVNIHASDFLPPMKRVSVGKGVIHWDCLISKLRSLPNLRQMTVELSDPQLDEIIESIRVLSAVNS